MMNDTQFRLWLIGYLEAITTKSKEVKFILEQAKSGSERTIIATIENPFKHNLNYVPHNTEKHKYTIDANFKKGENGKK